MLVAHDGQVEVVPEHEFARRPDDEPSFPPTVEVPKEFVRERERLELEVEHLNEQLDEHKRYIEYLQDQLETEDEVIHLDELDGDRDEPYQLS